MNDREIQESENPNKNTTIRDKNWSFCPVCGNKLPEVQNLRFCIKCGINLQYLKEYKQIKAKRNVNPYIIPTLSPQSRIPQIKHEPRKISDEDILNTKESELWGTWPSIGIPLGAFLLMNVLTIVILIPLIFIYSFNLDRIMDFMLNPYFIIGSTFLELVFILVPVLYIGQYLQRPTLNNRLGLLGFTRRNFDRVGLIKEILIGLGLALVGIGLVIGVSILTEILLETVFNVTFTDSSTETDIIFTSADVLSIILFSIVMILIVGTSEEILFRGFMQKGLTRNLGNWGGILLTALIFAMIHVIGVFVYLDTPFLLLISFLYLFIPYFSISLFLGLIYFWRNENLIAVSITHGVYDALTIILVFIFPNFF
ncbi:MAG: CPBP family intramembrane glutamic endopeptidase [Promethearchaeota archaeon]